MERRRLRGGGALPARQAADLPAAVQRANSSGSAALARARRRHQRRVTASYDRRINTTVPIQTN